MKKLVLFILAVTFVLGSLGAQQTTWYLSGSDSGARARNNQMNLRRGENFLFVCFPKQEAPFEKIRINFTIDRELEVIWQSVHQDDAALGAAETIGVMNRGPIETNFASFNQPWYVGQWGQNTIDTSTIRCVVLCVIVPDGRAVFTLTDVEFIGLRR